MESPELPFDEKRLRALQARVLSWYRHERRDLPWRRTRDPYAIWVSEIMLQQTRVETARPYYARFLEAFPTVAALAAAEQDDVLAAWSGLGYYSRARSLHAAAIQVMEAHGGALPADPVALAKLPGFGPYTVAAVGSIAFGLDLAAVDGNIARVLTRWLCSEEDPRTPRQLRALRHIAQALLPSGEAGDWNQALMELGATLCGAATPACLTCPARDHCLARKAGRERELPPRRKAKARPTLHLAAALVREGGRVLLAKRPPKGLFASLWELPSVEVEGGRDPREALAGALGAGVGAQLATVEQTLTHRELRITLYEAQAAAPLPALEPYVDLRWVDLEGEPPGGLSSATKKAVREAGLI